MNLIFITADEIGARTGGGQVTAHELQALTTLGDVTTFRPRTSCSTPFDQDIDVLQQLAATYRGQGIGYTPRLAHVYAGCFTESVKYLTKELGCKVTYTVAAHDVNASRRAHQEIGLPFEYPHLNDPELFRKYSAGYVQHADCVICPSSVAARTVFEQGRKGPPIEIIPHGHDMSNARCIGVQPHKGVVGYLGSYGADKGVITLLRAWKLLRERPRDYPLDVLWLAGRDSTSPFVQHLIRMAGASAVRCLGWVEQIELFYASLAVYCQPSYTEGHGIEVVEALACGTPVICSDGAGACDAVSERWHFPAGDASVLADRLDAYFSGRIAGTVGDQLKASNACWIDIRRRYVALWRKLLT